MADTYNTPSAGPTHSLAPKSGPPSETRPRPGGDLIAHATTPHLAGGSGVVGAFRATIPGMNTVQVGD